ncbi:crotonobetainyl-CoA:carnitine CoA-transferase CaiB-like acyl-CoA transferase [Geomicrobium halophilum]|uniref:Crotonobetainyl-CoA:carnitine CoA-transferase CaiB-like acyl-CoA transferase n=1 Tax=Geomicrobium halophilum TaxID=549000 RepID=A0A841PW89_9BACL|nr:CaiB/BaiF CoA-transferase family protein [Geomicrobium halophilum]MBB6448553.1 crotonobetainyl-CoA:carnitine CoA-transferase CaiB-like acyl-CoA transferase [Geomicrobium halophilum]
MTLDDIRVLDLTRLLPGPYATMMLADFGAEVIKIEEPQKGDYARSMSSDSTKDSPFFHSLNRNKKSVTLNLKESEGKETFLKMVETADVVIESFRPHVMEKLGMGYGTLKEINPGLVYCAITGYGQTGPYANRSGHDINYLSYAGILHLMGGTNQKPTVPSVQIADLGGGALPAVVGTLLALLEKRKTGQGQFVDVSMLDGVLSWLQTILPEYFVNETSVQKEELPLSGGKACYEVYETKDGRWLSVGALEPKFWQAFCEGIKKEACIPLLHAPVAEQHRLKAEIQTEILKKSLSEWMEVFKDKDACVTPLLTLGEVTRDPQVMERGMIQTVDHPTGAIKQIGFPIKLSETPASIRTHAPKLGEHTDQLLAELYTKGRNDG